MNKRAPVRFGRRELLKLGATAGTATLLGSLGLRSTLRGQTGAQTTGIGQTDFDQAASIIEVFPTSPLILSPFTDPLPIPKALVPVPIAEVATWRNRPDSSAGQQDADGGTHQIWPSALGLPDPLIYQIKLQVNTHSFTSSPVQTLVDFTDQAGRLIPAGTRVPRLPDSTIYGFNGTFPGPLINAQYGQPVIVRFENHLDENPQNLDRQDFGAPDWAFLTHLHNGHTAAESDGNPFHKPGGYLPGQWVDDLYLNYPPGGDEREKQSFLWFHDHQHSHTGANVYKGLVGLYPLYDPSLDPGDETRGLRLPGVRRENPDGSFDVDFDIPLAFYDVALDDGNVRHQDFHNGRGERHPEWWGKSFFRHFPNHGFQGDIFTVNGKAYPALEVKRRKYRLRFLDASIARIYEFKLMSSRGGPVAAPGEQGQFLLPDGQQCMRFSEIASEGGLLPAPMDRDSFELWPAKRREFIVDFTQYVDGSPTRKGDVIFLTNVLKMLDGRKPDSPDPRYKVPVLKIVVGDDAPDNSQIPRSLRAVPPLPEAASLRELQEKRRKFKLERGSGGESQWLINGRPFEIDVPLLKLKRGSFEVWEIENAGGGWVHPMHVHEEEHRTLRRNGVSVPETRHPDDVSKEDTIAMDEGESVTIFRGFRTFTGKYVAHCHNLAHEDHAMMFGWTIVP